MTAVIVVTAGGFGREVAAYARDAGLDLRGFLHDEHRHPGSLDGVELPAPVLGPVEGHVPAAGISYLLGLGDREPRLAVAGALLAAGARLGTLVHPLAWVAPSARLGEGVVVAPFAFVGPDAAVGDLCVLNVRASVTHDAVVGRGCVLSPHAVVCGRARLGDEVFLATSATVGPRCGVGDGATVGAGSVVLADVPAGALAVGTPARTRPRPVADGRAA